MKTKYNHKEIEFNKNKKWINKKYFSTHDVNKRPFTIILPPPNVTGKLHLGHAWNSYIQDSIIRYKKLQGFDVMWIPGMDHAGIATQAKVEEKLSSEEGVSKHDLKRNDFIDKVWIWKEEYANKIREQWSKLGLALDYSNEQFTLDEGLSQAVSKVFIDLYNRKLIFKGTRSVNFDVKLKTVLSNIEVENRETKQKMFYIKYHLEDGGNVTIATVRPETLFSDVALAINPKDKNNNYLVGKYAINPLTKRKLPIILDENIEIKKGTGIMKISAHAQIDIEIITKHKMAIIECIDDDGLLNNEAMEFKGLDRFRARDKIIAKLKKQEKIEKIEDTISIVGYSQRSNTIIETLVKPQWFVKMDIMSKLILKDLKKNGVKFFPNRFNYNLKQWMENVHDWCISRQLWWGHRIPAWYKDNQIKVQEDKPGEDWIQDEDVLDTWFSSGLAPFSFLGWPKNEKTLMHYYPTNLLVSGYDIIFFWVARMYFQSLDIMKQKPFYDVLIHGLIRTSNGEKMSKSLGNGIDPMEIIDKYGSDALRWFLLTNSSPGQDIRYSTKKIEAAWNINNKIWNISRYILEIMEQNTDKISEIDIWINNQLVNLKEYIDKKINKYDFTIIGKRIYKFIIDDFSSWYIEIIKTNPNKNFAREILKTTLIIIHPFLPFITDHIYHLMGEELLESCNLNLEKMKAKKNIKRTMNIIKLLRQFRSKKNISNKETLPYWIDIKLEKFEVQMINKLANASIKENEDALIPYGKHKIFIKISKSKKVEEKKRFKKEITKLKSEIVRSKNILNNEGFIKNASSVKIKEEKDKLTKYEYELEHLNKE